MVEHYFNDEEIGHIIGEIAQALKPGDQLRD